jgi:hypothetical protein
MTNGNLIIIDVTAVNPTITDDDCDCRSLESEVKDWVHEQFKVVSRAHHTRRLMCDAQK